MAETLWAAMAGVWLLLLALGVWENHLALGCGFGVGNGRGAGEPAARSRLGVLRVGAWLALNIVVIVFIAALRIGAPEWASGQDPLRLLKLGLAAAAAVWLGGEAIPWLLFPEGGARARRGIAGRALARLDRMLLRLPIQSWEPMEALGRSPSLSDEIQFLARVGHSRGHIEGGEAEMIARTLELDRPVSEIMVPAGEMVYAETHLGDDELLKLFVESGYSRLPLMDPASRRLIGLVHVKDFLARTVGGGSAPGTVAELARRLIVVGPETPAVELLSRFKSERAQMAVVADAEGAPLGLATMEDVLEELVGEIFDEHEHPGAGGGMP